MMSPYFYSLGMLVKWATRAMKAESELAELRRSAASGANVPGGGCIRKIMDATRQHAAKKTNAEILEIIGEEVPEVK